jgi:catechol-2,3-dioxygenase
LPVRRLNHAVLYVRDVPRSVAFYTEAFDFEISHEIPGRAVFLRSQDSLNDHDLGLFAAGPQAPDVQKGGVGLYHLAWEVGTLDELVSTNAKLAALEALVGSSDHLVSKSLYGIDPDGIEFEVMWRVPRDDWPSGEETNLVHPLDLDDTLRRWGPHLATGAAAASAT